MSSKAADENGLLPAPKSLPPLSSQVHQVEDELLTHAPSFGGMIPQPGAKLCSFIRARGSSETGDGPAGFLCRRIPRYTKEPPIETVVFACGVSEDGQLGLDSTTNVLTPKVVEAMLGLRLSGRAFNRTPIVAGSRNTLAIDASGQVWSWGWNERGTLGHGHRGQERKPQIITALQGVKVVQVAIGGWHCLALSDDGRVYAWGGNEYLQCGVHVAHRDVVSPLLAVPQLRVRMVACGGMHSLALTETGEVWTWGEPWGDFAMRVEREPRQVTAAVDVAAIACGAFHNMALTRSGEVFTWGTNDYGQLGNGNTSYQTRPSLVLDLDTIQIADIAAGGWHSAALSVSGDVWIWGRGEYGRLGIGDRTGSSKLRPQKVRGLENHKVVQIALGGTHTIALTSRDRIFIWGRGSYGRLGLGQTKDLYHPVELQLPGGHERWRVLAVAAGGRHTMCTALPVRDGGIAALAEAEAMEAENLLEVDGMSEPSLYDKDMEGSPPEPSSPPGELQAGGEDSAQWPMMVGGSSEEEPDDADDEEEDEETEKAGSFHNEERRALSPSLPRSPLAGSPAQATAFLVASSPRSLPARSPFRDGPGSPRAWSPSPSHFASAAAALSGEAGRSPSRQGSRSMEKLL